MWYEWVTSAYHDRRCIGRFRGSRGVQVVCVQTGGAPSTRTYQGWESPGRKQRWQLKTDQNGVKVWPNASTWMQVESRSRSKISFWVYDIFLDFSQYCCVLLLFIGFIYNVYCLVMWTLLYNFCVVQFTSFLLLLKQSTWLDFASFYFQARKYGYLVEICEPSTPWRLKASHLAKYDKWTLCSCCNSEWCCNIDNDDVPCRCCENLCDLELC